MGDRDDWVRHSAVQGLEMDGPGLCSSASALATVRGALADANPWVAFGAISALYNASHHRHHPVSSISSITAAGSDQSDDALWHALSESRRGLPPAADPTAQAMLEYKAKNIIRMNAAGETDRAAATVCCSALRTLWPQPPMPHCSSSCAILPSG